MKGLLLLTPVLFGLMATGVIAADDTYTTVDTGRGQEAAALTYVDRGNVHPAATGGTEVVGGKAPAP